MLHKSDYVPNGIPLVNPTNMVDSRIIPSSKMMVTSKTRQRLSSYVLRAGDIVIARRGELGRCALVTEEEQGWLCGTGSFFLRLTNAVDPTFFVAVFRLKKTREWLERAAVGTTMSNLNHTILNELPLPVPPLEEQRSITGKVGTIQCQVERLKRAHKQKLDALESLEKSLLHQALTGTL